MLCHYLAEQSITKFCIGLIWWLKEPIHRSSPIWTTRFSEAKFRVARMIRRQTSLPTIHSLSIHVKTSTTFFLFVGKKTTYFFYIYRMFSYAKIHFPLPMLISYSVIKGLFTHVTVKHIIKHGNKVNQYQSLLSYNNLKYIIVLGRFWRSLIWFLLLFWGGFTLIIEL